MSSVSKLFGTDDAKETDGVTVKYVAVGGTVMVKLARAGGERNVAFAKLMTELTRPYQRAIQNECMPPEVMKELLSEAYATHVVKAWDVTDDEGQPIPLTKENVMKEFADSPDFFIFCIQEATKLANYRKAYVEAGVKN